MTVILVAELDTVGVGIRAEVDFIVGEEVFYFSAVVDLFEMRLLSLSHCA